MSAQSIVRESRFDPAFDLAIEFQQAYDELSQCVLELGNVLQQPQLDRPALTTVRLKIAQLRLARGSLLSKIRQCLTNRLSEPEAKLVDHLHNSHYELLRNASEHTGKWTLEAIEENWDDYRSCAQALANSWIEKMSWEQEILLPLLRR